jgi:hypothetical protein
VREKTFLAFFLVEHHVIREKGRIGKDRVVNFLRTDVPSSHYRQYPPTQLSNFRSRNSMIYMPSETSFPLPGGDESCFLRKSEAFPQLIKPPRYELKGYLWLQLSGYLPPMAVRTLRTAKRQIRTTAGITNPMRTLSMSEAGLFGCVRPAKPPST